MKPKLKFKTGDIVISRDSKVNADTFLISEAWANCYKTPHYGHILELDSWWIDLNYRLYSSIFRDAP